MTIEKLINMVFRTAARRLVNKGVDAGLDHVGGGGNADQNARQKAQMKKARRAARHARKAKRMAGF